MKYDRLEMFASHETPDTWLWCLHCERAYQLKDMREVPHDLLPGENLQLCHYEDCDGDTVLDAWNWDELCKERGGPDVPERGVRYPLYG